MKNGNKYILLSHFSPSLHSYCEDVQWMDGWTDGWTDRWKDGRIDGRMDRWTDGLMDGRMGGWVTLTAVAVPTSLTVQACQSAPWQATKYPNVGPAFMSQ